MEQRRELQPIISKIKKVWIFANTQLIKINAPNAIYDKNLESKTINKSKKRIKIVLNMILLNHDDFAKLGYPLNPMR